MSAKRVNCDTIKADPWTSTRLRFMRPASSPNTRRSLTLSASRRTLVSSSSDAAPTNNTYPGPMVARYSEAPSSQLTEPAATRCATILKSALQLAWPEGRIYSGRPPASIWAPYVVWRNLCKSNPGEDEQARRRSRPADAINESHPDRARAQKEPPRFLLTLRLSGRIVARPARASRCSGTARTDAAADPRRAAPGAAAGGC